MKFRFPIWIWKKRNMPEKEIREEEGEILSPEKEPDEYVHIGLSGIHCKDKDR